MYYIAYGNDNHTLRRNLSEKIQKEAESDKDVLRGFAMDILYEEFIGDEELVTFVNVIKEEKNEVVFSAKMDEHSQLIIDEKF